MGVIKKILYRGNILAKPRHRNLFLDMEENIHIHLRDLRIELSRSEFEEISAIFLKQSQELQTIILGNNYQDGKLPNANQEDVRIWTESRLKYQVKYHSQRFSLEECGDGYHFHYRNYKLLIDPQEFRQIVQLFKNLDIDSPYASTYEDVMALLEANDVDFMLDIGNDIPNEVLAIIVAHYHVPKVRDIFKYIGFNSSTHDMELHFTGLQLKVVVKASKQKKACDYQRLRSYAKTERLIDYLSRKKSLIDSNELNQIKCQVIDLYHGIKNNKIQHVETDPLLWLYAENNSQVIFPYSSALITKRDAETLYKMWSVLLLRRIQL